MKKIDELLEKIDDLPPFPVTVSRVMKMLRDPDISAEKIADAVKFDQALTTNVLRRCNSSFFGLRREISSLRDAVVFIGLSELKKIIIRSGTRHYFEKKKDGYETEQGEIWSHVIAVSIIAGKVKKFFSGVNDDYVFIAALLHDVGKLVMSEFVIDDMKKIYTLIEDDNISFLDAEIKVIGSDHAEIGARILEKWGFPEEIIDAVSRHHLTGSPEHTELDNIVRLADGLAMTMGFGTSVDGLQYGGFKDLCEKYDITNTQLETIMAESLDDITATEEEYGFTRGRD